MGVLKFSELYAVLSWVCLGGKTGQRVIVLGRGILIHRSPSLLSQGEEGGRGL